ncbi:MAG: DNA primase DnaG [Nanoarchaeota archaeon]
MAKISPVSIKYMIHANFSAEGALEKPDVIGAIFGQTEGLLGSDLEMRDLQKEGKIGRIEVDLQREGKKTTGAIKIPTALDQSETTLIAAAIETIERIGPSDSSIEVEKIEDVRGTKRDFIIERAKDLMKNIHGSSDSREISNTIKESTRMSEINEYGNENLPCGDISGDEIIVVEGRADVVNLLRNNVKNVIAMNGTKLPESIKQLSKDKEITLFVDGDRGGKLILQNVSDNANIKYVAFAPDGKEVEELMGKEILIALRKRVPLEQSRYRERRDFNDYKEPKKEIGESIEITDSQKNKLKEIHQENKGSERAILLDENLEEIKTVSIKSIISSLKRARKNPFALIVDGTVNSSILSVAEEVGCKVIVAKNFTTVESNIKLLSL